MQLPPIPVIIINYFIPLWTDILEWIERVSRVSGLERLDLSNFSLVEVSGQFFVLLFVVEQSELFQFMLE